MLTRNSAFWLYGRTLRKSAAFHLTLRSDWCAWICSYETDGDRARIIFSTYDYSFVAYKVIIFSLMVSWLPIGPRTSPPLTSLMLSRQTFRLKIMTFPAESWGDELILSAETNTSHGDSTSSKMAFLWHQKAYSMIITRAGSILDRVYYTFSGRRRVWPGKRVDEIMNRRVVIWFMRP